MQSSFHKFITAFSLVAIIIGLSLIASAQESIKSPNWSIENPKAKIVTVTEEYSISDISENEFLMEYPFLSGAFKNVNLEIRSNKPILNEVEITTALTEKNQRKGFFSFLLGPELKLPTQKEIEESLAKKNHSFEDLKVVKKINRTHSIENTIDLSALKIVSFYQKKDDGGVKQKTTLYNKSNEDREMVYIQAAAIQADEISCDGNKYIITNNPLIFSKDNINCSSIKFGSINESYSFSEYNWSDIYNLNTEVSVYKDNNGVSVIKTKVTVLIFAHGSFELDPSWYNSSWAYRKSFTLSRASGVVANYQSPVTIGYGSAVDITSVKFAGLGATVSEAPYDDDTWTNPTNIYSDNATYASITISSFDTNDYSYVLKTTNLGNAVPVGCVIKGIKVEIDKKHANGDVIDAVVQLTKDNTTRVGDNKADTSTHWGDSDAIATYGGSSDHWGTTWTPEEVNNPNFGVHIVAQAHGTDSDAYIDFVRITIYYQYRVYTDSHCATDFDDIRFTDDTGNTELDYWLESKTDSDNALFWVEFNSIGTTTTTFYMYYGNAGASSASNGPNTFPFFDDFDGTLSDKWTVSGGATNSGSAVTLTSAVTSPTYIVGKTPMLYGAMEALGTITRHEYVTYILWGTDTTTNGRTEWEPVSGSLLIHSWYNSLYTETSKGAFSAGTETRWVMNRQSGQTDFYRNGVLDVTHITNQPVGAGAPYITVYKSGATYDIVSFKWLFLRNWLPVEPTWGSFSSEENQNPPSFTEGPSDGGSTSTAPTNVDSNITFSATSTDGESDAWKLLVCSTSSNPTASTSVPTCAGESLWCVSSDWASSTVGSTCTYTATTSDTETNNWWAFSCDNNASLPFCSTSSQGIGDNGSPFNVNHRPTFISISDDPDPVSPGATVTFATATTSDSDVLVATDTVKLFVCKLGDATSSGCGAGGTWATTTLVASNPSATTSAPLAAGSNNYFSYVFDNHNLGASTNGASSTFTISNVAPTVSTVLINSGSSTVNLIENSTTTVTVTATVSDSNGCGDIGTTTLKFYRSGKDDACSDDENDCYSSNCTQNGGSCAVGGSDTDATYTCLTDLWYYTDPTDMGTYLAENWVAKITAQDSTTASSSATSTIEVNSLSALDISSGNITYGIVGLDETSNQATSTLVNTGNTGIDTYISGIDMNCSSGIIDVSQQHYSIISGFSWLDGTALLENTATINIDLAQRTTTTTTDDVYWIFKGPSTGAGGDCTGINTFVPVVVSGLGASCTLGSECSSNNCVDNVCCDSVCSGGTTCQTCGVYSSAGVGHCSYSVVSQDPHNDCAQGSWTCDGICQKLRDSGNCSGSSNACAVNDEVASVTASKVCSGGSEIDASSISNSCDSSYDYLGSIGGCTYTKRYAECNGSGVCDENSTTYYALDSTINVTSSKVITATVSGGTTTPTIGDAASASNSCDASYDYWANANECTYAKRYAECDGSGTCDSDSSNNYTADSNVNVPVNNYSVAQNGGTNNPYTSGNITAGCTQTGCCNGATHTCNGSGIFGACSIVPSSVYLTSQENGSWDHNCDGSIDKELEDIGSCTNGPLYSCPSGLWTQCGDYYTNGWIDSIADCGHTESYVDDMWSIYCNTSVNQCTCKSHTETQGCR
ncbi:MAG: DUF2341 domain-containing protein [Candidatus Paceibacterota bacterium]|jgi:hypothetical protein